MGMMLDDDEKEFEMDSGDAYHVFYVLKNGKRILVFSPEIAEALEKEELARNKHALSLRRGMCEDI